MSIAQAQITCVIADDHPAVLDSVSRVLAAHGIGVLAAARDGEDAVRAIQEHEPTVAVVDLKTLTVLTRIKPGGGPDGMAWGR